MLTIKYEIYRNDYDRQPNLTKTFDRIEDFGAWLLDFATPYSGRYQYLTVDYSNYFKRFGEVGELSSRNDEMDKDIWVHQISNEDGIIFTDGKYTHGKNHISKALLEYFKTLEHRYIYGTDYTFID